jgi:hypothetical protein
METILDQILVGGSLAFFGIVAITATLSWYFKEIER